MADKFLESIRRVREATAFRFRRPSLGELKPTAQEAMEAESLKSARRLAGVLVAAGGW